ITNRYSMANARSAFIWTDPPICQPTAICASSSREEAMTNLYLSKVHFDWTIAQQPYCWHQQLWTLFGERPTASRDFLYRVEHMQIGVGARVLLQSALAPQISATSSSLTLLASKAVNYQRVQPQQRLRFYLTANVVKKLQGNR